MKIHKLDIAKSAYDLMIQKALSLYPNKIINGRHLSSSLNEMLKQRVNLERYKKLPNGLQKPVLGYILVGNEPDSELYVKLKKQACDQIGISYVGHHLSEQISQTQLNQCIIQMQEDKKINGILVQLPLPSHINEQECLNLIGPAKDVDGLHPINIGNLALKKHNPIYNSCTPLGCLKLIQEVCPDLSGKNITICGRSNIVGMPLFLLLNKQNATVTLCHSQTKNIEEKVRNADIFVSAIGNPRFFKGEWFKEGAIAIDVGINQVLMKDDNGEYTKKKVVGDIEFEKAIERCSYITPVPGGVGPMTIAMLLNNIVESWENMNFNNI